MASLSQLRIRVAQLYLIVHEQDLSDILLSKMQFDGVVYLPKSYKLLSLLLAESLLEVFTTAIIARVSYELDGIHYIKILNCGYGFGLMLCLHIHL